MIHVMSGCIFARGIVDILIDRFTAFCYFFNDIC